ncbi:MAG TPA: hypothetical protein VMU25_04570 [Candidatus Paceibacterota bacterium]|nr:hypothetical protein [Candidatus Paceibacterota bacterium]
MTGGEINDGIYTQLRNIRDFINQNRIKEGLLKNKPLFYQLCSCMDMVEDSQSAIESFGKRKEDAEKGLVYLQIFGLLQALFLQQDAALNLAESLQFEVKLNDFPKLKEIREIRNDAAGHPTKRSLPGQPPHSWNFIIQHSMGYESFEVLCWHAPEGHKNTLVKTREVINDQRKYILEILERTYKEIKRRDNEYKTIFNMKKVENVFPGTMGYMCEKMFSAVEHIDELTLGEYGATGLLNVLLKYEEALKERGISIETYPGVELTFKEVQYPLKKLKQHFLKEITLEKDEAYIFVHFVREKMFALKNMARELDEEFAAA